MVCYYIGGIFKYVLLLLVFINFLVNLYYCLVLGFEVLVNLVYLQCNCFVCMCILIIGLNLKVKCVEFCCLDLFVNFYMVFVVLLLVGLDGIQNKIELFVLVDKDIYEFFFEEYVVMDYVLGNLGVVFDNFEVDYEFFFVGDVFILDFIEIWVEFKCGDLVVLQ